MLHLWQPRELHTEIDQLERRFREWVRKGMATPSPSFDALKDCSDYLPADVIEMLAAQRGLTSFWSTWTARTFVATDRPPCSSVS